MIFVYHSLTTGIPWNIPIPNDPEKFRASHLHLARRGFLLRQAISQALELRSERLAGCGRDFAAGALGNGEIMRISWEFMGLGLL